MSDRKQTQAGDLMADLRALRKKIKVRRGGKPIDVDYDLEQMREEREREVLGPLPEQALTDANFNLENVLPEVPEEIKPVIGALYYHQLARAKLLISDFVNYIVRELQEPFYPDLGLAMAEEKARGIFTALDTFLEAHGYYQPLGPEVQVLVQTAREVPFSKEGLPRLKEKALEMGNAPDVQQAFDTYMDLREAGQLTCFYCRKQLEEEGTDASTEFGVLFGCEKDWRRFGNPDSYI